MDKLGIIIVHYGDMAPTKKLYNCIKNNIINFCTIKMVIINNDENNIGYGAACNYGYRCFIDTNYLLFLNNDLLINTTFIDNLYLESQRLESDFLCPKIIYQDENIEYNGGSNKRKLKYPDYVGLTGFIHGACFLAKTKSFGKVMFDPHYFLYWEDVDLSIRAQKQGLKTYYTNLVSVTHNKKYKINNNPLARYYHTRNLLFFWDKHGTVLEKCAFGLYFTLFFFPKRFLYFFVRGKSKVCKYMLKGISDFYKGKRGRL